MNHRQEFRKLKPNHFGDRLTTAKYAITRTERLTDVDPSFAELLAVCSAVLQSLPGSDKISPQENASHTKRKGCVSALFVFFRGYCAARFFRVFCVFRGSLSDTAPRLVCGRVFLTTVRLEIPSFSATPPRRPCPRDAPCRRRQKQSFRRAIIPRFWGAKRDCGRSRISYRSPDTAS